MAIPSWFSWKKVVIVASFGAALFLASFMFSGKIGAYGFWGYQYDQYSAAQYGGGEQTMVASYYGAELAGSPTASGAPFDPSAYTAAHKTLPLGTQLEVSGDSGTATVTVNDRGPYVGGRDLDLSQAAAEAVGVTDTGVAPVQVDVLN